MSVNSDLNTTSDWLGSTAVDGDEDVPPDPNPSLVAPSDCDKRPLGPTDK